MGIAIIPKDEKSMKEFIGKTREWIEGFLAGIEWSKEQLDFPKSTKKVIDSRDGVGKPVKYNETPFLNEDNNPDTKVSEIENQIIKELAQELKYESREIDIRFAIKRAIELYVSSTQDALNSPQTGEGEGVNDKSVSHRSSPVQLVSPTKSESSGDAIHSQIKKEIDKDYERSKTKRWKL